MAKKTKKVPVKSPKKIMASEVENRISETLKDLPKRASDKKYQKKIHKASRMLVKLLAFKPMKISPKKSVKKTSRPVPESKVEVNF